MEGGAGGNGMCVGVCGGGLLESMLLNTINPFLYLEETRAEGSQNRLSSIFSPMAPCSGDMEVSGR